MHEYREHLIVYSAVFLLCSIVKWYSGCRGQFRFVQPLGFMLMAFGFLASGLSGVYSVAAALSFLGLLLIFGTYLLVYYKRRDKK